MEYQCNRHNKQVMTWLAAAVSLLTLLATQGCSSEQTSIRPNSTPAKKAEAEPAEAEPAEAVEEHHVKLPTMRVSRSTVPHNIEFPGKVTALPDHSISISPNIAGKISQILVVPGQQVKKGQLIATLNDQQLRAQLLQATAPQKAALNAVAQAKISLDLAEKNLSRTEALFDKDIVAEKDVVTARSQALLSKSQVEAAEAKVSEAMLAPAHLATQMTFTKVYSPISGVVAHRFLNVGSAADPSTPIAHVVNLSQVMINANMPADSAANPRVGQSASVTTVAEPGVIYYGKIESISPTVDSINNTISIEILTSNDHSRLKEGQQVTVAIGTSSASAVLVPITAIVPGQDDPSENYIFRVSNGKLNKTKITIGQKKNNQVPVLKGLNDGEEIVTSGAYGIPDGAILDRGNEAR